ncbi:MAG: hypothetical protein H6563_11585 [Lewinellaceae bacterium]|nr:hypothetical protein [Lewinellaceae bacterium]
MKQMQTLIFCKLGLLAALLLFATLLKAQDGVWKLDNVKDRTPDLSQFPSNKKWSGKTENQGMVVELQQYSEVSKRMITDRAQASWTWSTNSGQLLPGSQLSIQGTVTNLGESSASAWVMLGTYGFTTGGMTAAGSQVANFSGVVNIPQKPALKPDGSVNPYITITFHLTCSRSDSWIERVMTYKWTPVSQGATAQPAPPAAPEVPAGPQLIPAKTEFAAGEEIVVQFKNLPGYAQDWIGIYGATAYHANEYIEWKYTNGAKDGTMRFASPRYGPGEYMLRVYENNGYKLLAQSIVIRVR